ncbi:MAG: ArnT family glycosyltransferase [Bacteroidota bacterium]
MKKHHVLLILGGTLLLSVLMHLPHFSKDLMSIHVWRQTQTQSTINSFYEEDMNIFHPRRNERGNGEGIFRMEFPLMQWLVAATYHITGKSVLVTRIFMFLTGLLTLAGLYLLLIRLFRKRLPAVIGVWTLSFSPLFFYYTINPLPDNLSLCCAVWGLALFMIWTEKRNFYLLPLSGFFMALAALCKLPFIIYFIVPGIWFLREILQEGGIFEKAAKALSLFVFTVLPAWWYITVIPHWDGNRVILGVMDNKESLSVILDYLQFNLLSNLPEMLLNYGSVPLFLAAFWFLFKRRAWRNSAFLPLLALALMALLYYFFELNAIAKVHDYYLFPFMPLLFIMVAYGAFRLLTSGKKILKYSALVLLLVLPFTCHLRLKGRWNPESPGFNKDLLVYKTELRAAVPEDALVVVGNDRSHFIFLYYIDKKGWGFDRDNFSPEKLQEMIGKGAAYLYTDSDMVKNSPDFNTLFDSTVMQKGSVTVYCLKREVGDNS